MEYNLTFLEACKALDENRCERIGSENNCRYAKPLLGLTLPAVLGKWRLIGEKLKTEERTTMCWLVVNNNGDVYATLLEPSSKMYDEAQTVFPIVKTYIYIYPEKNS